MSQTSPVMIQSSWMKRPGSIEPGRFPLNGVAFSGAVFPWELC